MKIILSYPFSGALYSYIFEKIRNESIDIRSSHGYYKTLYGSRSKLLQNLAVTLLILYDEIYMAPADHEMPNMDKYYKHQNYMNKDLGLYSSWKDSSENYDEIEERITKAKENKKIQMLLAKVPQIYWNQILKDTILEMRLSMKHEAPIISTGGRKSILKTLSDLENDYNKTIFGKEKSINATSEYIDNISLSFNPSNLEDLYEFKNNKDIRKYAKDYIRITNKLMNGKGSNQELNMLLRNSLENESLLKKIDGITETISQGSNIINLIFPKIQPLLKVTNFIISSASKLWTDSPKANWYQFGTKIQHIQRNKDILRKLEKKIN